MNSLGLYLPGEGPLHRWHPLTKIALVAATFLGAFAGLGLVGGVPLFPWVLLVLLGTLAWLDGAPTGRQLLRLLLILLLPFALSLFLVQGFFYPDAQEILLRVGPFALKQEGLIFGARIFSRFVPVLAATLLFVLTTHPADLTHALTQVGVPYEIAYVILAALQLLPRMQARAQSILSAQQARGLRTEGSLWVRLRALVPLIGPLITSALHETEERALALEARAFRAPGPKSAWRQLHDSPAQRVARWTLLLAGVALFVWGRWG